MSKLEFKNYFYLEKRKFDIEIWLVDSHFPKWKFSSRIE